ncbi:MAG TPA: MFS transporter [Acidimicrobiales bacterium]|nr:MFS transporter [Acidimicrobiales bacterium]
MTTPARTRKAPAAKKAAPAAKTATAKKATAARKAPAKKATAAKKTATKKAASPRPPTDVAEIVDYESALEKAIDVAALEGLPIAAPPPDPAPATATTKPKWTPLAAFHALNESVGNASLVPLFILLGLSAVERFDAIAFGVLSPEIQKHFHLTDAKIATISGLTAAVPILLSVPLGYLADRVNRVRLSVLAAFIWGITAIFTGLAPILLIFILARLVGGVGLLINEPVHPSLLSDWYPPESLTRVNSWHRQAGTIGLIGGPLAGVLGDIIGWRSTFVVLAIPTFVLAFVLLGQKEPPRGGAAFDLNGGQKSPSIGQAFKRIRAIRSARRTWVSAFLFGSGTLPFATFLNLYLQKVFDLKPFERGIFTAIFGGAGAFGLAFSTKAVGKYSMKYGFKALPVVSGGMVTLLGIGVLLMAGAPNAWVAGIFACVAGIGSTGFLPPYLTLVALVTPANVRSQAFSWSLLFYALGALTFSGVVGGIADQHGYRVAFIVLAALVIAGGLIATTARNMIDEDIANSVNS